MPVVSVISAARAILWSKRLADEPCFEKKMEMRKIVKTVQVKKRIQEQAERGESIEKEKVRKIFR